MDRPGQFKEFDIRVKRIRTHSDVTGLTVFDAVVLDWRPRRKEWTESKRKVVCVGYFYGIVESDHLHIQAKETEDPIYGPEWIISTSKRVQPGTEVEMVKFLTSISRVGARYASVLVQEFGLDVISVILKDSRKLMNLKIPQRAMDNLHKVIVDSQGYEQLLTFLVLNGIPAKYAAKIYRKYGTVAVEKICDNPYSLYFDEVLDFFAADRLNHVVGGANRKGNRLIAGLLACARDDSERFGNLYIRRNTLAEKLRQFFCRSFKGTTEVEPPDESELDNALLDLVANNYIVVDSSVSGSPAVYLVANYHAESRVAERLHTIMTGIKRFYAPVQDVVKVIQDIQEETGFRLDVAQAQAITAALTAPVSILTGGPGTGKTQTTTMLIEVLKRLYPTASIRLCAPTGKAAMRVQELTNQASATIHRLIGYPHALMEENTLVCDIMIVDEFSMCDILLCSWLFRALSPSARLVIIGDHEQLPSVGPGLVLRDMIDSGVVPVTRLTTVFRQSGLSRIVKNAHAIMETPATQTIQLDYATGGGGDFYFIQANSQSRIAFMIQKSVNRLLEEGFSINQIEVLSPIHASAIGSDNLNLSIQELLNTGTIGYPLRRGVELRVGDKVIQTRNDYDLMVFNGETGIVAEVAFSPGRAVRIAYPTRDVWYDSEQAEDLDLAYAITTHRGQGSEFQAVIIPIHETILYAVNKTLMYTAITRAQLRVILIGTRTALEAALKKEGAIERSSNLTYRIKSKFIQIT